MLERLAGHEYYCFLDGFSGYFQISIALEDQEKTTFTCPYRTFAYKRMPFRLCNAPATFQCCMTAIFHELIKDNIEVFMDDFSDFGSSFDHFLKNLENMLKRWEETNLVLNWDKCHFMVKEGIILGHKVSGSGIEVDKAKIEAISKLPYPTNVKAIQSFLGHAGGHHGITTTARKVFEAGFYWPNIYRETRKLVRSCDPCQRAGNIFARDETPQKYIQHKFFNNVISDHLEDIMASLPQQEKSSRPGFTGHIYSEMHVIWSKVAMHANGTKTSPRGTKHLKSTSKSARYLMFGKLTLWDLSPHQMETSSRKPALSASLLICLGKRNCVERIPSDMAPLPHRNLRHPWLRYHVEGYDEGIVHNYEHRLKTIWSRSVIRVHVLAFARLADGMRQTLADRMSLTYIGDNGWEGSKRVNPDKGDLRDYWMEISSNRDFLGPAPSYVFIRDPHGTGTANVSYLLAHYLFRHAKGRKNGARLSRGHFIGHLVAHFRLIGDQGLSGLLVVASELLFIDLHELLRLNICLRVGDTWAWVAPGPERQQATAAGALGAAEDALAADEGAYVVPTPVQAPQPPPITPQHQTMTQRIDRLEEETRELQQSVIGLRGVVESFITEQTRVSTWMISFMTQLMDASGRTYQAFDITLFGSSWVFYQRRVRPRTDDSSTSSPQ
uniref:RNA-directed DNA polymerase homolog n=1 Tax=Tanacetum cinerariifolium TaxID=118510 RepID=A0A6L2NEW6_TANCI|nr:RNA-directed DNA polymerase homolog [Tanacetum cinerariifolium]